MRLFVSMLKFFFRTAWHNLNRQRTASFINVSGHSRTDGLAGYEQLAGGICVPDHYRVDFLSLRRDSELITFVRIGFRV